VKLLFDENLSPRLVASLGLLFPGSSHVHDCGLQSSSDAEIWEFARLNSFVIVTKDADYNNLSVIRGTPPKVIWLLIENCTTGEIEVLFRNRAKEIEAFAGDPTLGTLAVR
jgi:predicted nuclease of predicted toxin-antitoxin system